MDKRVYLKVKIKSLANEARIIRQEERKCKDTDLRNGLTNHRKNEVRREARSTLIAYGFMNGKKFYEIERMTVPSRNILRIIALDKAKSMIKRYGGDITKFDQWTKSQEQ